MADEIKDQRVITLMTPTEVEAIDDWSFKNRVRSRGEAIRRLCQMALAVDGIIPQIAEMTSEILRRRTDDAKMIKFSARPTRSLEAEFRELRVDVTKVSLNALTDHARLQLATISLLQAWALFKKDDSLDEILATSNTESEKSAIIAKDLEILRRKTAEDGKWIFDEDDE